KAIVCSDHAIIGLAEKAREALEKYQTACRKTLMSLMLARKGPIEGPRFYSEALLLLSTLRKLTLFKKEESKLQYATWRNTMFECPIFDEIMYED
ncbi:hypothetical protein PENTCL1PPCAC_26237, partial [Pristionchus entomophagus]